MGFLSSIGASLAGIGGSSDHPSGSSDPWFQQWFPQTGGVTGQPNVDPSQLKQQDPGSISFDPSQRSPTTGINGGQPVDPSQLQTQPSNGNWQLPGDQQLPGYGDWSTSNPWRDSLTYDQIKNYGGSQSVGSQLQKALPNANPPGNSAFGQAGGMGRGGFMSGILSGIGGGGTPGGLIQQAIMHMKLPSGRVVAVPSQHVQEALRRGAQHLGGG